ncbi:unnamed protein product, partial [Prunus brigantina]
YISWSDGSLEENRSRNWIFCFLLIVLASSLSLHLNQRKWAFVYGNECVHDMKLH